jgi:uncharacterized small protein (TIGR04563 family)
MKSDQRQKRQCLYIQVDLLDEIRAEADRLDRSLSWIMQRAWRVARRDLASMPGANDYLPTANDEAEELREMGVITSRKG